MKLSKLTGARIQYCGHKAVFSADVYPVGSAVVIRALGPISETYLDRTPTSYGAADYHLTDTPEIGFWRPDLGVFVVPKAQLRTAL
jgi:hypothetical protein